VDADPSAFPVGGEEDYLCRSKSEWTHTDVSEQKTMGVYASESERHWRLELGMEGGEERGHAGAVGRADPGIRQVCRILENAVYIGKYFSGHDLYYK
jgi:hypothetical protein